MNLLSKTIKSIVIMGTSNYIKLILSLISFFIIIWSVNIEEYGRYILALSISSFLIGLSDCGTSRLVISEVTKKLEKKDFPFVKKFLKTAMLLRLGLGILLSIILVISIDLFLWEHREIGEILKFSVFYIISEIIFAMVRQTFFMRTMFWEVAKMDFLASFSKILFLLILVWHLDLGGTGIMTCLALSSALSALIMLPNMIAFLKKILSVKEVKENVYYQIMLEKGKYLVLASQIKNIGGEIPVWLITYYFGTSEVGLFGAAKRMLQPLTVATESIEAVALPMISKVIETSREKAVKLYLGFSKIGLYTSIGICLIAYFLVPVLIENIFPEQYTDSIPIFNILLILVILHGINAAQRALINSIDQQKSLVIDYMASLGIFLLCFPFLTAFFGFPGAVISFVMQYFVVFYRSYRISKLEMFRGIGLEKQLLITKEDVKLAGRTKDILLAKLKNS